MCLLLSSENQKVQSVPSRDLNPEVRRGNPQWTQPPFVPQCMGAQRSGHRKGMAFLQEGRRDSAQGRETEPWETSGSPSKVTVALGNEEHHKQVEVIMFQLRAMWVCKVYICEQLHYFMRFHMSKQGSKMHPTNETGRPCGTLTQ